jgi:hypothetical protein
MKWNILVASMVLGLSTQSFGFDLLDRMLGGYDKDPCQKACDHPCAQRPGLGLLGGRHVQRHHCDGKGDGKHPCAQHPCAQRSGLGLLGGHHVQRHCDGKGDGKHQHPCAQRPGLGLFGGHHVQRHDGKCDDGKGHPCAQRPGLGLFGGHPCHTQKGDVKHDGKGGHHCAPRRMCGPSLLERIFACRTHPCHDGKGKGGKCDGKDGGFPKTTTAEGYGDEVPMPPAPVVDPSAFRQSPRSVVQASTTLVN